MRYREFLQVLGQHQVKWCYERGIWGAKKIRCGRKNFYCPITFVCKIIMGKRFKSYRWWKAAELIKLRNPLMAKITWASDGVLLDSDNIIKKIREDLIKVTNLCEKDPS